MTTTTPPTIMLIDDDSRNIFALTAVLKSRGFTCVTTTSAAEGVSLLEAQPGIGIVLLDMMMPEMDGYETLSRIRKGRRSDIPVIAVTAQAMAGDREKCIQAGANAYVSKPINVDELLTLLQRYLP
ncbi:response regulator [Fulvivirgaceae bacterium PWU5]|uniref:Response regulator n=1 Tax=Dawidia cretensis TaxID=2782350 RepID=A0AAP2DZC6_9BACT|nr:response regulator [Dawidia cretensis]MBT1710168.1 response regulator [Dawidia cretensis]